jgi:hypothetical protein
MLGNPTQIVSATPNNISLAVLAALDADESFGNRVKAAIGLAAQQVQVEATSVPFHDERWAWARQAIQNPNGFGASFVRLCLVAQLNQVGFVTLGVQATDGSWPIDLTRVADGLIQSAVSTGVNLVAVTDPSAAA